MKHILTYDTFNESKLKNFVTGAMLLASLLGNAKTYTKGDMYNTPKVELAVIDKQQYSSLEDNLEKMNYQIYGIKPSFDSHQFLFSTSTSTKFKYALNEALQKSEKQMNDLEADAGYQHIYYVNLKNTWQVIVITEIVSEEEEGREYDKSVGIFRGL
jgi:hypothetical protein